MLSLLLPLLAFSPAHAADSMMIAHQSGKVTIVVNEQGQRNLALIFRSLLTDPNSEELGWSSNGDSSSDVIFSCRRGGQTDPQAQPHSCTFSFSASSNVQIQPKAMAANLGDRSGAPLFDLYFENAAMDRFRFQFFPRGLAAVSQKK